MKAVGQRIARAREHAQLKQKDVAKQFAISSQAVSQWESGRTRPDSLRLAILARMFNIRLEWLLDGSGPMSANGGAAEAPRQPNILVPIVNRAEASDWAGLGELTSSESAEGFLHTDLPVSGSALAVVIDGRSMEPDFQPGDKVIIDPMVPPRPGDFVMAKRDGDQEATFRKYRLKSRDETGGDAIDLLPLNPDWPSLTIDRDNPGRIVGTMVEHRRYRRG